MWFQKPPLGTPLDWENPLNDNLALHLAMNEGHGDRLQDLSLNGNHGTMQGFSYPPTAASGWNPGRTGRGLKWDGTSDTVRIPDSASLSPTSAMSAFVWVKGAAQNDKIFFSHYDSGINQRCFRLQTDSISPYNKLRVYISDNGITNNKIYYSSITAFDNSWHLVGFTFDAGTLKLYIDGAEDSNVIKPIDDAITTMYDSTADIMIGSYLNSDAPAGFFTGGIDQPRIVAGAWTPKQCMDYAINPWQVYLDEDD